MVQTAESDVIAPAVAAEDSLALLDEAVTEFEELLADIAAAVFHQRDELVGDFLGLEGAFIFSRHTTPMLCKSYAGTEFL